MRSPEGENTAEFSGPRSCRMIVRSKDPWIAARSCRVICGSALSRAASRANSRARMGCLDCATAEALVKASARGSRGTSPASVQPPPANSKHCCHLHAIAPHEPPKTEPRYWRSDLDSLPLCRVHVTPELFAEAVQVRRGHKVGERKGGSEPPLLAEAVLSENTSRRETPPWTTRSVQKVERSLATSLTRITPGVINDKLFAQTPHCRRLPPDDSSLNPF